MTKKELMDIMTAALEDARKQYKLFMAGADPDIDMVSSRDMAKLYLGKILACEDCLAMVRYGLED